jgi:putative sugar O-methyltransferase
MGDARYDLKAVAEGFRDRMELQADDAAILQRICSAYQKAWLGEAFAADAFKPTTWWEMQRRGNLEPVMRALAKGDIEALQRMYRNFYRDACSAGLILTQNLAKEYLSRKMSDQDRRYVLADTLYRVNHWKQMVNSDATVQELEGPGIGNPFGVVVEGTLVSLGSEYQHFCAFRIAELLKNNEAATVVEIGGGYGGMAYYLLRECPTLRYVNFDVPESVALASYFLMRSYPERRFLLYGEAGLCEESLSKADAALLPLFAMRAMEPKTTVAFSSHAMSDLSEKAQQEYAARLSAMGCESFLCIGDEAGMNGLHTTLTRERAWTLEQERDLAWHSHRNIKGREIERVYRRRG